MRAAAVFLLLASASAFASEPNGPLTCGNWTINAPGISCRVALAHPCGGPEAPSPACSLGVPIVADNSGGLIYVKDEVLGSCNGGPMWLHRHSLMVLRDGIEEPIAHIDDRCGIGFSEQIVPLGLTFDAVHGVVRIAVRNLTLNGAPTGNQLLAFEGFERLRFFKVFPYTIGVTRVP